MGKKISDRIISKITGRDVETIYISMEEMVDMVDKYYIKFATTDEQKKEIVKVCKGGWLRAKELKSMDGKYELSVSTHRNVGIFNIKDRNYMWIHELSTDKFYEYRAFFWGKFIKTIKDKVYK